MLTDSPFETLQAEDQHRDHAIVEQVFAGWYEGPLAHLPSSHFFANAAWTVIAAIAQNLLRAAGTPTPTSTCENPSLRQAPIQESAGGFRLSMPQF